MIKPISAVSGHWALAFLRQKAGRLLLVGLLCLPQLSFSALPTPNFSRTFQFPPAWREQMGQLRLLGENDAPAAYRKTLAWLAGMPANATAKDQVRALNLLARIELELSQSEQGYQHAQQADDIATANGDRSGQAEAQLNIANYALYQGNIDLLASATMNSLRLFQAHDDPKLLGEARLGITTLYRRLGQLEESVATAVSALEEAELKGNPHMLAYAHRGLGISYLQSNHVAEAGQHFRQMLKQAEAAHSKLLQAYALMDISDTETNFRQAKNGEAFLHSALKLCKETGIPSCEGIALNHLAENLRQQGRIDETFPLLAQAENQYRKQSNKIGLWWALKFRSRNYQTLGETEKALQAALEAYTLAQDIGFPLYQTESARQLSSIYAEQQDFNKAYRYALQAIETASLDARATNSVRTVELARKYASENKQRQIDELKQQAQIERAETRQHWLWTVLLAGSGVLFAVTYFLLRLRRSKREIVRLNATLEKRVEQRTADLLSREQEYRTLAENSPNFIARYDTRGNLVYANPAYEKLLDSIDASPLLPKPPAALVSPRPLASIMQVAETGHSLETEFAIMASIGNTVWMRMFMVPERDAENKIVNILGIGYDVTDRKLRESQDEIRLDIYERLAFAGDLTEILDRVVTYAETAVHRTKCTIYIPADAAPSPNSANIDPVFTHREQILTPTGQILGSLVAQSPRPLFHDDTARLKQAGHLAAIAIERQHIHAQLRHQARYDVLTGLPNRRLFNDRLHEEIANADRSRQTVGLLFVDLDRFKEINDTLGHDIGDKLLIEASKRIRLHIRESDTLARLGGDEFVIVVPDVQKMEHLTRMAQAVIQNLQQPFHIEHHLSYLSASIGIASYPMDACNAETLLSCADQAMYEAKERGRNGFSFFTSAMQEEMQQRLHLATDMREALAAGQLMPFFQPIIDTATGRVVKAEALLRWRHPDHGMVSPQEFIPIAEEMGIIHEMGDWIFLESVKLAAHWIEQRKHNNLAHIPCQISVNISPRQFMRGALCERWLPQLHALGIPAQSLVIEITEGLLLDDKCDAIAELARFRNAGIEVALDDFGTGYSSMAYLKRFNIDYLKIDRSFVNDLEKDQNDRTIVEAIVAMARKLGLKVIAEGVENQQQRDFLAAIDCDFIQGYLYARPMPVGEFLEYVAAMDVRTPERTKSLLHETAAPDAQGFQIVD